MSDTAVRPGRVLRIVLVSLLVAGLGVVALGAIAWCSFFGCTVFSEDFEPHGREATRAREEAVREVAALADGASVDGRVLASRTRDGCVSGQNDWKRKDTYSHECDVAASRLVVVVPGVASVQAVADGLTRVDATLRRSECVPSGGGGLDRVRDEYWRETNPNVARDGVAGLPSAHYDCPDGRRVEVEALSSGSRSTDVGRLADPYPWYDDRLSEDWYTVEDVRALREADAGLALVVTASETYYRTRF
ncbi:hypothetical protein ACK8HX_00875 [Oryzobacter sp. R7]|uniref:hypothetical protein n=1 Tax=Oryzobacter faecalis TaxID=3388656 RepID=UPI00398D251A